MRESPEIILVAPHPADRLESIERYVRLLAAGLSAQCRVKTVRPESRFARMARGPSAKWLGYLDKYIVFPKKLRALPNVGLVHICDQASAPHVPLLRSAPHLVTCFDLIAVRSARGEFPNHPTRWSGRRLQQMILTGLAAARNIVCISEATRTDLVRFCPETKPVTIPLAADPVFAPVNKSDADKTVYENIPREPFILHVGGNQWYKNRAGVIAIYRELATRHSSPPNLVLAGRELSPSLQNAVHASGLAHRIFSVAGLSDTALRAFYSCAKLLLFPSLAEGFGWPILEAQACGTPVITSSLAPMTAVAGTGAVFVDPCNPRSAAEAVCNLLREPPDRIAKRIQAGFENVARFSVHSMIDSYLRLYSQIANGAPEPRLPVAA